jgi:uncharacterized protein (TIGR03435 family)
VDNASRWVAAPSADRHGGRYAQLELEIGVIFTELEKQLGLRLEPLKRLILVLVIDHLE